MRKCKVCGAAITDWEHGNRKYCGEACAKAAKREGARQWRLKYREPRLKEKHVCKLCGKAYVPSGHCQLYCSEECRAAAKVELPPELKKAASKQCPVCGKNFSADNEQRKYCSQECQREAVKARSKKEGHDSKVCACCGKRFESVVPNRKFCSEECEDKGAKRTRFEELSRQAQEVGLSYGRYMAALKFGKTYEEMLAAKKAREEW